MALTNRWLSIPCALAAIALHTPSLAQTPSASLANDCGAIRQVTDSSGLLDYRLRNVDQRVQLDIGNVNRFHTEPARRALSVSVKNRSIIADLDFTLRHSPNHTDALRLLMDYERRGGQSYEFPRTDCYFVWALQYAPDDISVVHMAAQYYWKSGNATLAEELFQQALQAHPESAELNYNAGLFYFSRKDYARSREYARVAYAQGYPLPGLRTLLEREKQWTDK